ncbi:MAG: type II secretion system F family protein [Eubacteriales bacterium]
MKKNSWQQDISKSEYVHAFLRSAAILQVITYLFYHSIAGSICFLPILIFYMKYWENQQESKLKSRFEVEFKDYLQALAAALRTGYAVENAMREARKDIGQQYKVSTRIMRDTTIMERLLEMNMPVEYAWKEWADRVQVDAVEQFTLVFIVAKRSGGDSVAIIRKSIDSICEKLEMEAEIKVILASKKFEFQIMSVIPLGILIYMKLSFPDFMAILYESLAGTILMTLCLIAYGAAVVWGNKIVQIEV